MTDDEMNEAHARIRRMMEEVLAKGLDTHSTLMAQVLLARADVNAAVELTALLIKSLPPELRPAFAVKEEFLRLRREETEGLLISLENQNPAIAAEIQRILDESSDDTA